MSRASALEELERWARESREALRPLPASLYTSPEILQRETDKVFHREWICAGHVSELSKRGDYIAFDIVGKPVLVVCDEEGTVRAFSNICRHRGTVLATGHGNLKAFVCPYHAWTYDSSGHLRAAPYMDKTSIEGICLPQYRVEIWQGLVFVNLDPEASALAPRLAGLEDRVAPYDFAAFRVIYRAEADLACNWKVLVENASESYHHFKVHRDSIESSQPTRTIEHREGGSGFSHHTLVVQDTSDADQSEIARLPPAMRSRSNNICVFPSLILAKDPGGPLMWVSVLPTGPQTMTYTVGIAIPGEAGDEVSKDVVDEHRHFFESFMNEDLMMIEQVQRGLASGTDFANVLHPWERPIWEFGHYLARRIADAPPFEVAGGDDR